VLLIYTVKFGKSLGSDIGKKHLRKKLIFLFQRNTQTFTNDTSNVGGTQIEDELEVSYFNEKRFKMSVVCQKCPSCVYLNKSF
jgi:hypothetical protein